MGFKGKAQARQSEGIKDAKVLDGEKALARPKDKQATLLAAKDVKHGGGRVAAHELLGLQAGGDDEVAEEAPKVAETAEMLAKEVAGDKIPSKALRRPRKISQLYEYDNIPYK